MTDRINALTVVLNVDIRDDDAEPIIAAIRQIRHVLSVAANVSSLEDHVARTRVRQELTDKLWEVLHPKVS
jgi:hypothetical protein